MALEEVKEILLAIQKPGIDQKPQYYNLKVTVLGFTCLVIVKCWEYQ